MRTKTTGRNTETCLSVISRFVAYILLFQALVVTLRVLVFQPVGRACIRSIVILINRSIFVLIELA